MPPILAAILANLAASGVAGAAAPRLRAAFARWPRSLGESRDTSRRAPQRAAPRVVLTAPLSYGPRVPQRRPSVVDMAARLAGR